MRKRCKLGEIMEIYEMPLEMKIAGEDDDFYKLEGIASTPDIDLADDIVVPEAIIESIERVGMPSFRRQHNSSEGPLGTFTEIKQVGKQIVVKAEMPKRMGDTVLQRMAEAAALATQKAYKGFSIGFNIIEKSFKDGIRIIEKINLIEISLVDKPCNTNALLTSIKNQIGDGIAIDDMKSLSDMEAFLKAQGCSNKEAKKFISKVKSLSRDVEEKGQRDAEMVDGLKNFEEKIKETKTKLEK
jgi:hypothetical protein